MLPTLRPPESQRSGGISAQRSVRGRRPVRRLVRKNSHASALQGGGELLVGGKNNGEVTPAVWSNSSPGCVLAHTLCFCQRPNALQAAGSAVRRSARWQLRVGFAMPSALCPLLRHRPASPSATCRPADACSVKRAAPAASTRSPAAPVPGLSPDRRRSRECAAPAPTAAPRHAWSGSSA